MTKMSAKFGKLLLLVAFVVGQVQARIHPAYLQEPGYCINSTDQQPRWMSTIPDSRPLALLSIPGTHDSLALHGGHQWQCQSMSLAAQLEAGIRALDIRCRHVFDTFLIYHAFIYQHLEFKDVLTTCADFLSENPSEMIIMRVKKEWLAEGNNQTFEETFVKYIDSYPGLIWRPEAGTNMSNLTLGQVRGKIVILQDFDTHHHVHNEVRYEAKQYGPQWADTVIQDDFTLITIWSLYSKWLKIKSQLHIANESLTGSHLPQFHVNFLSASVGVKPYFAASGNTSPGTDQPRQYFGLINAASPYRYEDFPRDRCLLGGRYCLVYFEGMNILTYEKLAEEKYQFVGIVYADFPGCGLIQAIIAVNKKLL